MPLNKQEESMRKYETPEINIYDEFDVITTSADVTTEDVNVPWKNEVSNAGYEL